MAKDGTWTMLVKVEPYVPDYVQAVTGKWTENADGSVTLTVTGGDYKDGIADTFSFTKGSDGNYSGNVKFTADEANGIVFTFNFKSVDINSSTAASASSYSNKITKTSTNSTANAVEKGEMYRTPIYHGIYSGVVGDAYITFLDVDTTHSEIKLKGKIFAIYVDADDGYSPWVSGYWDLSSDIKTLKLTQEGSGDAGLTGATASKAKTYKADSSDTFSIDAYFPSGGTATFTLSRPEIRLVRAAHPQITSRALQIRKRLQARRVHRAHQVRRQIQAILCLRQMTVCMTALLPATPC